MFIKTVLFAKFKLSSSKIAKSYYDLLVVKRSQSMNIQETKAILSLELALYCT